VARRIQPHAVRNKKWRSAAKQEGDPTAPDEFVDLRKEFLGEADQHKDDPRTWSPIVQEWEAFKAIKQLITGPHEFVPESFVRESIARQLDIKPEDVTRKQFRLAVTELFAHYPAITVTPQEPVPDADKAELGELRNTVNDGQDNASDRPTSIARDSRKTSNPSHEKFQIAVDAAKKLLLRDMQEVAHRLRGMPITVSYESFPDIIRPYIRNGFALFFRIAKKFPNEISTDPAKWAGSVASEAIIEKVKNGPFEIYVPQLVSLLGGEEAEAILLDEAILEEAVHGPSEGPRADLEIAKNSTGITESKKRRGPQANMKFHRAVADVLRSFGSKWRERLDEIAAELDKRHLPSPAIWVKRNPPARSWKRAVAHYPDVVLKTLAYCLKMTERDT
jgi:hypothetical protein